MSSAFSNMSYASLGELSPSDNSGNNSFDVDYLQSSYGVSVESGYYADSEFVPASSEQFSELGPNVYSDSYSGYDGSQVVPIYYPLPTYYQVYYGVSSVENNGTTFYHYYPFAVPIYCLSSEGTTENISSSDVSGMSDADDFTNEIFENVNESSLPSELITENTSSSDVSSVSDEDDFTNEISANVNDDRDSSTLIPENEFTVEERKNDVKRKKDWLYLLSLSGKLHVKDHIPEVHVMPEILEEDEDVEISEEGEDVEISEGILQYHGSLEKELWTDVIPEIDKSDGDQKNPNEDEIESSYANGADKEKCQAMGEGNDVWNDFFYSIDDPVFGIEACFSNTSEKKLINESFHNDLDKNNVNLPSTCRRTFKILPRLNKQIQILPTIQEEKEPVVKSEILHVMVEKTPVEINKENTIVISEGGFESKQQNAGNVENNCGLPEATEEGGTSEKPKKKKRFKRMRRFFSELRSCFRKIGSPPG